MSGLALFADNARRQPAELVAMLQVKVAERTVALVADMRRRRQNEEPSQAIQRSLHPDAAPEAPGVTG